MTANEAIAHLTGSTSSKADKQAAFSHIYEHHAATMAWAAVKAGAPEPEDVVQSMFAALPLTLIKFDSRKGSLGNFLYWCAYYRAISEVRQESLRRRRSTRDPLHLLTVPAREPSPDEGAAEAEESEAFLTYLETLTPEQREAFRLRYVEELGVEEVAAKLNLTDSQTYRLLHRARTRLREFVVRQIVCSDDPQDDPRLRAMLHWLGEQAHCRPPALAGQNLAADSRADLVQVLRAHRDGMLLDALNCHLHWRRDRANGWCLSVAVYRLENALNGDEADLLRALRGSRIGAEVLAGRPGEPVRLTLSLELDADGNLLSSSASVPGVSPKSVQGVRLRLAHLD